MNENGKSLELIKLLKVDEGKVAGERMGRWAEAFEDWIEARRTRFSPNVGEDSCTAWREFLAFIRQVPWEVRVPEVEAYVEDLRARGLRPGTITKRLTGLSKFYEHCQQNGIDPECEVGFNPVTRARRPKVRPYEGANYLSRKEEAALLEALWEDPSPMGKRDYALILMLIKTGWRAGKVRELRWGERETWRQGEGVPEEVWEAIRDYLEASGRLAGIKPEDYVYAPSKEPYELDDFTGG